MDEFIKEYYELSRKLEICSGKEYSLLFEKKKGYGRRNKNCKTFETKITRYL